MITSTTRRRLALALRVSTMALLGADAAIMTFRPELLSAEFAATGFRMAQAPLLAAIVAVSVLLYAIPRTALLGAIGITGFLGGAICAHFRLGELGSPPQFICIILGVMAWAGAKASAGWRPWLDRPAPSVPDPR